LILFLIIISAYCCTNLNSNEDDDHQLIKPENKLKPVEVFKLKRTDFALEKIYNAKIMAQVKAKPRFNSNGFIKSIKVKNGDRVYTNQIVAIQETQKSKLNLEIAMNDLETAKLKLQNILIGQGYGNTDSCNIPEEIYSISLIKSGYNNSMLNLKLAKHHYESCFLRSPVNGIIANMNGKLHQNISPSEEFCTIVEEDKFFAVFKIFETELTYIKKSDKVQILCQSYPKKHFEGTISEINPIINESGLIEVKAIIKNNYNNTLIDGMNANIIVQNTLPKRLVIPRTSLVKRSGKNVVFTYKENKAKWNYIEIEQENLSYLSISDGLSEGDTVIVSNNLNLSHDLEVKIQEKK
jgi:multidrug efflux pump subunit AcrA (membrane-fusion protein)